FTAGRFQDPGSLLAQRPLRHEAGYGFWGEVGTARMAGGGLVVQFFTQHASIFPRRPDNLAGLVDRVRGCNLSILRVRASRSFLDSVGGFGFALVAQLLDTQDDDGNHGTHDESGKA